MESRVKLNKMQVKGFKSIKELDLEIKDINILIGGNGSGKSNLLELFNFLQEVHSRGLADYTVLNGGANYLLHYGAKNTDEIGVKYSVKFFGDKSLDESLYTHTYVFQNTRADTLVIKSEQVTELYNSSEYLRYNDNEIKPESSLTMSGASGIEGIVNCIPNLQILHINDTSDDSPIKKATHIDDGFWLHRNGANLAARLYHLKITEPKTYLRIIDTIRLAYPGFKDFILKPYGDIDLYIKLLWQEKGKEYIFSASQLPDGLLRFIALTTILHYREDYSMTQFWGSLILIDEPELGLHPYAISLLAGMVREASNHAQIILATQSETLVDQFGVEDIIVVDRIDGASCFSRLDEKELEEWLKEYTISELWAKNVISGRP